MIKEKLRNLMKEKLRNLLGENNYDKLRAIYGNLRWFSYNFRIRAKNGILILKGALKAYYYGHYRKIDLMERKKILGVWDFNEQTGTIGDSIVFMEVLNVLRIIENVDKIDVCYIDDHNHPNAALPNYRKNKSWKENIMSTKNLNPYIDSVFHFSSNEEFNFFLQQNLRRYSKIWPMPFSATTAYDMRIIRDFYKKDGFIPMLKSDPETINWALLFIETQVYPALPIVVNIRNNIRSVTRNSNLPEWGKFFEHFASDGRFKFVIICDRHEMLRSKELRKYSNILFSKDYSTTLEQDMALIQVAHMCIFPNSGMSVVAYFTGVPFLQFRTQREQYTHAIPFRGQPPFLNSFQKFVWESETYDSLLREFSTLVQKLDEVGWKNPSKKIEIPKGEAEF